MYDLTIIVAMDKDRAIGKDGKVPWHLSADMDHFRNTTIGKVVVMGRKTFESLPHRFRPLPERRNIVMTKDLGFIAPGCTTVHHAEEVIQISKEGKEIFIIGGGEIYKLFLPHSYRIITTHVDARVGGDVFFPPVSGRWHPRQILHHEADKENQFAFSIISYIRI